jgi:excinuclease UvrABC nuclease subunit
LLNRSSVVATFYGLHHPIRMEITWEVRTRYDAKDARYNLFKDGKLFRENVPEWKLKGQLLPHGISGDDFEKMRKRLAETGRAEITVPEVRDKFRQIG